MDGQSRSHRLVGPDPSERVRDSAAAAAAGRGSRHSLRRTRRGHWTPSRTERGVHPRWSTLPTTWPKENGRAMTALVRHRPISRVRRQRIHPSQRRHSSQKEGTRSSMETTTRWHGCVWVGLFRDKGSIVSPFEFSSLIE